MPIIDGTYFSPGQLSPAQLAEYTQQQIVKAQQLYAQSVQNSSANAQILSNFEQMFAPPNVKKAPPRRTRSVATEDEMSVILDAKEDFTFGCDPELFVFNDKGVPVPADMIPGTKNEPHPVEGGAVQRDGFAAEFNINPVSTFKEFNENIEKVMKELKTFLPVGYELRAVPSVTFDKEIFDAAAEDIKELGCSPDYNAWEGTVNPPPKHPSNPYLRTAAGHLHIGWTSGASLGDAQHVMNCTDLVKQLDWYLGGWSVKIDTDTERRALYGKAGACRFKDYGVEYRVLSNFWVTSRDRRLAVWNRMQQAIKTMSKGFLPDLASSFANACLVDGIDTSKMSPDLLKEWSNPLVSLRLPPQTDGPFVINKITLAG